MRLLHPNPAELAQDVAGRLVTRIAELQAVGRVPRVCLTGGGIATQVHRAVAAHPSAARLDWTRVDFWWGDERFVDGDSSDRNALGARRDWLDPVGATRVHEIPGSDQVATAEEAAAAYSATIREHAGDAFDVLMLGIGPDGHVASLFPGHPALRAEDAIAVAVHDSPKPPPDRVTLTFEALSRSREVWFLVSGASKAGAVAASLAPEGSVEQTPARGIQPLGEVLWFLDQPAAAEAARIHLLDSSKRLKFTSE